MQSWDPHGTAPGRQAMPDNYLDTNVADRRRVRRRRLQRPASVTIRATSGGDVPTVEATLLNLSEHGLACRLETGQAERLPTDRLLAATFRLPIASRGFVCPARVVNSTPCGDPGRSIVGMEFVFSDEQDAERRRLRRALDGLMEGSEAPLSE